MINPFPSGPKAHRIQTISLLIAVFSAIVCGCTSGQNTPTAVHSPVLGGEGTPKDSSDPWEDVNRSVFAFNQDFDRFVFKPITDVYRFVLPNPVQDSVHSFLSNLGSPLVFINDVLQGEGSRSMDTLARFLINSTLGIGGLFDPAAKVFNIEYHTEDFGQTLGAYGWKNSSYIVLPILGPSNPRDMIGLVVDFFADPASYAFRRHNWDGLIYGRLILDSMDKRSQSKGTIDQINAALDPYSFMRSAYRQNRRFHIENEAAQDNDDSPTPIDDDELGDTTESMPHTISRKE